MLSSNSSHCCPEDFLPEMLLLGPLVEAMKKNTKTKQPPQRKIRYQETTLQIQKAKSLYQCYLNKTLKPWKHAHLPALPISNHTQEQVHVASLHTYTGISAWLSEPRINHCITSPMRHTAPYCGEFFSSLRTLSILQDIFLSWTTKHFAHWKLKTKWPFFVFCFGFAPQKLLSCYNRFLTETS